MLKNSNFSSILIYFIPLALITGPLIPDVLVSLVCVIFLFETFRDKNFKIFKNIFFVLFSVFYVISFVSSLFSDDVFTSLKSSFFYFRFGILALCIYKNLENNKFSFKVFFFFLLIVFSVLLFDGFYQYFFGKNLIGIESVYGKSRLNSFFGDEYVLGSYLTRLIFLFMAITYKVNFNNINKEILIFPFLFLTIVLVFLTGERTAFYLIILSTFLFLILSNYSVGYKIVFISILTFSIVLFLNLNESIKDRYLKLFLQEIGLKEWEANLKYNNKEILFLPQHSTYFIVSYKMFKDKKLIGHGNKSFSYKCKDYSINQSSCSTHPHNTYMQLLAENGLINFFIILSALFFVIYKLFNSFIQKSLNNYQLCLISNLLITLWPLTQTGNFFNNWLSIIYFLPVGFIIYEFKKTDSDR